MAGMGEERHGVLYRMAWGRDANGVSLAEISQDANGGSRAPGHGWMSRF